MRQLIKSVAVIACLVVVASCAVSPSGTNNWPGVSGRLPIIGDNSGLSAEHNDTDPIELVNLWRVTAAGETPDTWLWLGQNSYSLWRPCGEINGSWAARTGIFLASNPWGMSGCNDWDIPWLSGAVNFRATSTGIELLDNAGHTVANLRVDGGPPSHPYIWDGSSSRRPPVITDALRSQFVEPAPLPPGFAVPTPTDLVGRWVVPDELLIPLGGELAVDTPFAEFHADGNWRGSDGCNGLAGAWRLGPDGQLLGTSGLQTAIGCLGANVPGWLWAAGRVGLSGNQLTVFDRTGTELGHFLRD